MSFLWSKPNSDSSGASPNTGKDWDYQDPYSPTNPREPISAHLVYQLFLKQCNCKDKLLKSEEKGQWFNLSLRIKYKKWFLLEQPLFWGKGFVGMALCSLPLFL